MIQIKDKIMPIQRQFRLNKNYITSQHLLKAKSIIELANKITTKQTAIFPINATNGNISLTYKELTIYGNLQQVQTDIQEINSEDIFDNGSLSLNANLNPIKTLSVSLNYPNGQVYVSTNNLTKEEFDVILKIIEEFFPISQEIPIQPSGITSQIEVINTDKTNIEKPKKISNTVFIIMSFNDEHRDAYYVAIQPTLIKLGFKPIRVDEIQHNNTVTKEIIEAIENSAFVIADLTGERPNVYYEVGYAHKADKEVVLVAKKGTAVHFDVAAINRIDYKDYTDLCDSLEKRVKSVGKRLGFNIE